MDTARIGAWNRKKHTATAVAIILSSGEKIIFFEKPFISDLL